MASVFDVAQYILQKAGPMTAMKLQKLVYYSQAWSLVWDEQPLFNEKIEAWANGPVCPALYQEFRGSFEVKRTSTGSIRNLNNTQRETIDAILKHYGTKSAHWLSDLTHRERPWKEARSGLRDGERGNSKITNASMAEYYGNL